jgi:hypothetical protein
MYDGLVRRLRPSKCWKLCLHSFQSSVVEAVGKHPFPFRTRKLSPPAPMVVRSNTLARVGRRRFMKNQPAWAVFSWKKDLVKVFLRATTYFVMKISTVMSEKILPRTYLQCDESAYRTDQSFLLSQMLSKADKHCGKGSSIKYSVLYGEVHGGSKFTTEAVHG